MRLLAVLAALAAHLLLGVLLIAVRGPASEVDEPAIVVNIQRWLTPHPKPAAAAPPRQALAVHRTPPPLAPTIPSPVPLPPTKALDPNGPLDPRLAAQNALRGALQDTVRCAHADQLNLTGAEREHCRQFVSRMGRGAPTYDVNVDDHAQHNPPVASHGTSVVVGPPPPFPGAALSSPRTCDHTWCEHPDERRGP